MRNLRLDRLTRAVSPAHRVVVLFENLTGDFFDGKRPVLQAEVDRLSADPHVQLIRFSPASERASEREP